LIVKRSGKDFSIVFLRRRIDRIDTIDKMERPLSDYLVNESCKSCKSCLVFSKWKHRLKSVPLIEEKPPAIAQRAALRCTVGIDPRL